MVTQKIVEIHNANGTVEVFVPAGSIPVPPIPPIPPEVEETERPPDPPLSAGTWFQVFQNWTGHPEVPPGGAILWTMQFSRTPLPDPVVAPSNVPFGFKPGFTRWNDRKDNPLGAKGADRVAYRLAYWWLQHADEHDYLDVLRFYVQSYGGQNNQINDKFMTENPFGLPNSESQGEAQYPYETGRKPLVTDKSNPGATFLVFHQRKSPDNATRKQLLRTIEIPPIDPNNPLTRWWYQDTGRVVATNTNFVRPDNPDGVIALLIVTANHFAYTFEEARFRSQG